MRRALTSRGAFRPRAVYGNVLVTALRAGSSVAVSLLGLYALGRPDLIPYAAMGCFTALYSRDDTYTRRARVLAVVGLALTVSVALGGLTSALVPHPLAAVVVVALVAAAAKHLSDAFAFGAPAGLMFAFAAGVASYNPQTLAELPLEVAVTACAAALCWALALVGNLVHPSAPERLVVARALYTLARHLRSEATELRTEAEAALYRARHVLLSVRRPTQIHQDLDLLLARAEGVLSHPGPGVWCERVAADMARVAPRVRRERDLGALLTEEERANRRVHAPRPGSRMAAGPGAGELLRAALRAPSPTPVFVLRILVAGFLAGVLAWVLGIGHGYWAAVSAASVLQATNVTTTWHRTLQRAGGTLVGVGLAAVLFSFDHTMLSLLILVVLCQTAAELVVGINYSYAIVFVTPLTLALSGMMEPAEAGVGLATERLGATVLGALVGIVVCGVLANRRARAHLEQALEACERACADLEARRDGDPMVRHRVSGRLVALVGARNLAVGEPWAGPLPLERVEYTLDRARALLRGRPGYG